ncbi:hypothetical protein B0I35DRAFT_484324 [Stachybotrys elegans]|uniref:Uncharacterized protein n=1 Tax=Stachybotrys elegans TaxID=80388 RepID=A0A8K0SDV2_9HYPO|nr:hypothetical protein B0I35DRAFT_484324 [Stachybotrys elegans]
MAPPPFLHLPREIRDAIYCAYFAADGGYVYNFKTRKLEARGHDGEKQPIDQALRLTCKQVAGETDGLALNTNTIHFSSDYSDEARITAARFQSCAYHTMSLLCEVFRGYLDDDLEEQQQPGFKCGFNESILEEVIVDFPKVEPFLRHVLTQPAFDRRVHNSDWGLPFSYVNRALLRLYELVVKYDTWPREWFETDPDAEFYESEHEHFLPPNMLPHLKRLPFWSYIPPGRRIGKMWPLMQCPPHTTEHWERRQFLDADGQPWYTDGKYRFSAASAAIAFLSRFPSHLRTHLRRIYLDENAVSVAYPETHALGFIPYCQENPRLRIKRRVDMWRTVFMTPDSAAMRCFPHFEHNWKVTSAATDDDPESVGKVSDYRLARRFAVWVTEALELEKAGMPKQSFQLILDGDPVNHQWSELFQTAFQRFAVWQKVAEMICEKEKKDENIDLFSVRLTWPYIMDGFLDVVQGLINGRYEVIHTTFDMGPMVWDVNVEFKNYGHMSFQAFTKLVKTYGKWVGPASPLPGCPELIAECILPQFWEEREPETLNIDMYDFLDSLQPEDEDVSDASDLDEYDKPPSLKRKPTSYNRTNEGPQDRAGPDAESGNGGNGEGAGVPGGSSAAPGSVGGNDEEGEPSQSLSGMVEEMTLEEPAQAGNGA